MLTFLKLGGSLITDKSQPETPLPEMIANIAVEISSALQTNPELRLVIGHGSGSYGHVAASEYQTMKGVGDKRDWIGFAHVSVVAARLNNIVLEAFHATHIPVMKIQPSATANCRDGKLENFDTIVFETVLNQKVVPLIYGDVAIDSVRGGTIMSTEELFYYLAEKFRPDRILLAGEFDGVVDEDHHVIPVISSSNIGKYASALSGSKSIDVTGGMASKVYSMLKLCQEIPNLEVHIFSGETFGNIQKALLGELTDVGTRLTA